MTGKLLAFFRSRYSDNIWQSEGASDGLTWSAPRQTALPQNNKAIQAAFLRSGSLVLVFNNNRCVWGLCRFSPGFTTCRALMARPTQG